MRRFCQPVVSASSHLVYHLPKLSCHLLTQCWCSCLLRLLLPWWRVPGWEGCWRGKKARKLTDLKIDKSAEIVIEICCFDKGKHHILSLYFCEGDSRSLYSKLNEQICLLFLPLLGIICGCNENVYQWNLQSVLPCCAPRVLSISPGGAGRASLIHNPNRSQKTK